MGQLILSFFISATKATIIQLFGILGIFFVLGFIHASIQSLIHQNYNRTLGWKGILWTAWIGTPIHELGHAFFAKLFGHKINRIAIFVPNEQTGNLGHVDHSYNPHSLYQKIGNFFIGSAPMIFGSIFLLTLLYYLVPNGKEIFAPLKGTINFSNIFSSIWLLLKNLFAHENVVAWNFWVFLYVSFAISSHMAPSKADRGGMWNGLIWLALLLFLVNAIAIGFGTDITQYILGIAKYMSIFVAIFLYAIILSTLHLLLSFLLFIFKR
ncbi:MAG: hypothetical protein HYV41_02900 [Candidatus Magasanikbacteria bacterium]|nr:hypothetical protein [Candidatus Magasanikbacteria bacterium]